MSDEFQVIADMNDNSASGGPLVLTSTSVRDLLESPMGREAISRGCANVLDFEAVQVSLGQRWPMRREQVWDYIQQALERRFARSDIIERVSDTDYLVLTTAENSAVALTACLRCLQEILVHFLGACRPSDLKIRSVASIEDGELDCRPIDPTRALISADLESSSRQACAVEARARGEARAASLVSSLPNHDLVFTIENVISVRHAALAGGRLRRRVTPRGGKPLGRIALCALDTPTLFRIDLETVALAHDILTGPSALAYPLLRTPVSLQTLGHSASRRSYLAALRELPPEAAQRVIVEIVNLDEGTPASRVSEAVGFLAGSCRAVVAFTDPTVRALAALQGTHIGGVTVEASQLGAPGADRRPSIAAFADAARSVSIRTAIRGVLTEPELTAAKAAGVTYLIYAPPEPNRDAA